MSLPSAVTYFVDRLSEALPESDVTFDRPADAQSGEWWIDLKCKTFRTTVSWKSDVGFGVFTDEDAYGGRPDEIYRQPDLAAKRVVLLCEQWRDQECIAPLWLGEVRKLTGTPQTTLASALKRNQPSVSKLEAREDVKLSSLASYLEAMGGRLEMRVHFKDWDATIALPATLAKQRV